MSYTPKPWTIEEQDDSWHLTIVDAKGRPIANVARNNRWMPMAEGSANATLVVAAPDLLEAAEAALSYLKLECKCCHMPCNIDQCAVEHCIRLLKAAIEKAKGGRQDANRQV